MRLVIFGSRDINDYDALCAVMHDLVIKPTEIVSGGARGVDKLGERWALEHLCPATIFKAQWDAHGLAAGPLRNEKMALYVADALPDAAYLCLRVPPTQKSNGTDDMLQRLINLHVPGLLVYQNAAKLTGSLRGITL